MRDIRPTNKKRGPWQGSAVPVSSINVPPTLPPPRPVPPRPREAPDPTVPRHTLPEVPRRRWRIGRRERLIMLGLLLVAIVTGALAALIFLPTADVTLVLRTAPLLVEETVTLQADAESEGAIPGTAFFREVQVEGSTPTTGEEVIGGKAQGVVDIVNRTSEEQKIKGQSRLVTEDGTLFYMQKAVTLPAGPSRVSIKVEADQAGENGNVEPQKLFFAALDENARSLLYAEVTKQLTGGSGDTVPVVTGEDLESARSTAGQVARAQVEGDILKELPPGWKILNESWSAELATFETSAEAGQREAAVPFSARALVRVMGYEEEALEQHLRGALEERMDKEYILFPGPLAFTNTVKTANWEEGKAELSVRVTHTTIPNIQLLTLRGKLMGQPVEEAKKYLEGLPGVRSASVTTWPFWVTSVPRIEDRVRLELQSERQP